MAIPAEKVPLQKRIYAVLTSDGAGSMDLLLSEQFPTFQQPAFVFLWRGMIPSSLPATIKLVSDPASNPTLKGAAGDNATNAQVADAVAAYLAAHPPAKGDKGDKGNTGPAAATMLGTVVLARSSGVAIALGDRDFDLALAGVKQNDALVVTPVVTTANPNGLPAGWALRGWIAPVDGTVRLRMTTPLIALNAAYSMTFRVDRLNA